MKDAAFGSHVGGAGLKAAATELRHTATCVKAGEQVRHEQRIGSRATCNATKKYVIMVTQDILILRRFPILVLSNLQILQ